MVRVGGFLLGGLVGLALSFSSGPFWLFGPHWFVLPVVFGLLGAFLVRRVPGGRALSVVGYASTLAVAVLAAIAIWYFVTKVVLTRHGWF